MTEKIHKSEDEWKQQLTPEQYSVTRQQGTEPAFSGTYYHHKANGTYHCICCENPLFLSQKTSLNPGRGGRVSRNLQMKRLWKPKPTTTTG